MEAEWSVAAGDDDPVIVVPWSDEQGEVKYVDLREKCAHIEQIGEAAKWPEMREALLQLNAAQSPVWTAKCDAWVLAEEERQLDFGSVLYGFGAYFDVFWDDPSFFSSLLSAIFLAESVADVVRMHPEEKCRAEFVVRPAEWHGQPGYAITAYVFGYGAGEAEARSQWREALETIVGEIQNVACTHRDARETVE